jgi:hypothetical protein
MTDPEPMPTPHLRRSEIPLRALAYEDASATDATLTIVRTIGALSVVLGPTRLVMLALGLWVQWHRHMNYGPIWGWTVLTLTPIEIALGIMQFIGGAGCLRRRIKGRKLLVVAAWGSVVASLGSIVVATIVQFQQLAPGAGASMYEYAIAYYVAREVGVLFAPIVTIVFLTRRPVVALFG